MVGSIWYQCFEILAGSALNWNRFLAVQRLDLNSLNLASNLMFSEIQEEEEVYKRFKVDFKLVHDSEDADKKQKKNKVIEKVAKKLSK